MKKVALLVLLAGLSHAPAADPKATIAPLTEARDRITKAMDALGSEDDWIGLGPIGQYLTAADPDFDTRSYGHKKLSGLVTSLKIFETRRDGGNQLQIRRID